MSLVDRPRPGDASAVRVEVELPCRPDSPSVARARLEPLERELDHNLVARIRLLVTELVGNFVRRAEGDSMHVVIEALSNHVRAEITVRDRDRRPLPPDPTPFRSHGLALLLVRRLADRWDAFEGRRGVWFELDKRPRGS